jgi:hypothetical protein
MPLIQHHPVVVSPVGTCVRAIDPIFADAVEGWVPVAVLDQIVPDILYPERFPHGVAEKVQRFQAWQAGGGVALPPLEVEVIDSGFAGFDTGLLQCTKLRLGDGNHRLVAARRLDLPFVRVRWTLRRVQRGQP